MAAATCCFALTRCERMSRMIWLSIFSGCSNSEITALTFERKSIAILSKIFINRSREGSLNLQVTRCGLRVARLPVPGERRCELFEVASMEQSIAVALTVDGGP